MLRYTPAKTQFTSGAMVTHDLTQFRMVMEELEKVPAEARRGPLIVNPRTRLPYKGEAWRQLWDDVRKIAGIPKDVWNRDMRAAASDRGPGGGSGQRGRGEGHRRYGAHDRGGHDRARLAAARRTAHARNAYRDRDGNEE
jgi:hypothetical protein